MADLINRLRHTEFVMPNDASLHSRKSGRGILDGVCLEDDELDRLLNDAADEITRLRAATFWYLVDA